MAGRDTGSAKGALVTAALVRGLSFAAIWALLTRADSSYLGYGLALVPLATALSLAVSPPRMAPAPRTWLPRAGGFVMLIGWFLGQTLIGGVDVAKRALARPTDIAPYTETLPVRLPAGPARELAEAMINLMPGTVIQNAGEGHIDLHVLSTDLDAPGQWAALEDRVAAATGVALSSH